MGLEPSFEPGERFGDLRIERRLGAGAFGTVYLAHDVLIGRDVALKVLDAGEDDRTRKRALREARAVGRLNHPHIASLYRVHEPGDLPAWLFELEYVEGGSLSDRLDESEALGVEQVEVLVRAVADALGHAHERDVVHGDIKPSNILVARDGRIKLVDFGLARLLGDLSMRISDSEQAAGGTPLYMSPEIVMGQEASPASDIWSFGVLVYRLLAGRTPFTGREIGGLFHGVLNEDPPPLPLSAPLWLSDLAARCLQKDPQRRPSSASELHETIARPDAAPLLRVPPSERPVFGQAEPLKAIEPAILDLRSNRGSIVVITGAAGAGKSLLLHSARGHCQSGGARWIECTVSRLHGFQRPLLAALQDAVGIPEAAADVLDVSASTEKLVHALYGDETHPPLEDQLQLYWVLEHVLRKLARQSPLCLAIEDAQHADTEDLSLLRHLAHYLAGEGVLFFITCRTQGDDDGAARALESLLSISDAVQVPVEPLPDPDIYALMEQRLAASWIAPEVQQRIAQLAQGNPLLCTELVRHLRDTGAIIENDGRVAPGPTWESARLPRRLRDLAEARLAALDDEDRHLLDIAAVDGVEFDGRALATVAESPLLSVMRALQRIRRRKGVIRPTQNGFRFASSAMQEIIYAELSPEMRRAVHRALAVHLEQREEPAAANRIATHWERCGERERARPHYRRAMADALRHFEYGRAVALANPAGLAIDDLDDETTLAHAELLLEFGNALGNLGEPDSSIRLFERVRAAAALRGRERLALRAQVRAQRTTYFHRGKDQVDAETLRTAVESLGECAEAAEASYLLGVIAKYDQRYEDAERHLQRALDIGRRAGFEAVQGRVYNELAGIALRQGQLREAEALFHDAARAAEHSGRHEAAGASRVNAVIAAFSRGELSGLAEGLRETIRTLSIHQSPILAGGARVVLANVLWSEGESVEAERVADDAVAIGEQTGHLSTRTTSLRIKAEICAARGDLETAMASYEDAVRLLEKSGNVRIQRTVHGLAMRFRLWEGDPAAAARECEPCLKQLRIDAGEAARIAIDLGEGIFFGLPLDCAARIRDEVDQAEGSTPEMEAAREFVRLCHAWRAGAGSGVTTRVDRFLALPLSYRRAQCHLEARVIRAAVGSDALSSSELARLHADAADLRHHWLRAEMDRVFGPASDQ